MQVTEQILSWNPRGKLIQRETGTCSAERVLANSRQSIGNFGERLRKRMVKRSDAKRKRMSWQQREQIDQDVE